MHYIKLMRPHHYIKNALIFLPLIFSGQVFNMDLLLATVVACIGFCLLSSVVYIVNDVKDVENDRQHSTKKNRPIASGKVSVNSAIVLAAVLFVVSVALMLIIGISVWGWVIFTAYFLLNMGYSVFGLKNIVLVDIAILVSGFLLRVMFGAVVSGIVISNWLYLTVIAASFYLALGKRRNEITSEDNKEKNTRKVLKNYTHEFLDKNMYVCLAEVIVFYSLWSTDKATMLNHANSEGAIWTVPLVILIMMRYSMNVEGDSDGDPTSVLLRDKLLIGMGLLYAAIMFFVVYGG